MVKCMRRRRRRLHIKGRSIYKNILIEKGSELIFRAIVEDLGDKRFTQVVLGACRTFADEVLFILTLLQSEPFELVFHCFLVHSGPRWA